MLLFLLLHYESLSAHLEGVVNVFGYVSILFMLNIIDVMKPFYIFTKFEYVHKLASLLY